MEEKKEKKTIKCSYAVLVIILFAALAFVTDYAYIERKTSKCNCPKCGATNNEVISDNTDNTQVTENEAYSYEDIVGVYHALVTNQDGQEFSLFLTLNDDYTFVYNYSVASGNVIYGNYIIDNDKIVLNSLFVSGHGDATVRYHGKKFVIDIISSDQVVDNSGSKVGFGNGDDINNIVLNKDSNYQNKASNFEQFNAEMEHQATYRGKI